MQKTICSSKIVKRVLFILSCILTQLKDGAFGGCKNLRDVSLPSKLTLLGSGAFSSCPIQYIEIPETVEEIGVSTFSNCNLLHQVVLHAFSDCDELKSIVLPASLETIGDWSFSDCTSLGEVYLPPKLQQIGDYCFNDCAIQYINIPESVKEIGAFAFHECEQLNQVNLHAGFSFHLLLKSSAKMRLHSV